MMHLIDPTKVPQPKRNLWDSIDTPRPLGEANGDESRQTQVSTCIVIGLYYVLPTEENPIGCWTYNLCSVTAELSRLQVLKPQPALPIFSIVTTSERNQGQIVGISFLPQDDAFEAGEHTGWQYHVQMLAPVVAVYRSDSLTLSPHY